MTFLEHLDELRTRLIRSLLAILAGVAIAFPFRVDLYNLLLTPQRMRIQNVFADGIAWLFGDSRGTVFWHYLELWLRVSASELTPFVPNFRSPMEPFTALFKICLAAGFLIASPVVLYQIWAFVVPALKDSERRVVVRLGGVMTVFFFAGVAFAFFIAAPLLLEMSANLWRRNEIALQPENLWTFNDYMGFLFQLILAFGVAFQLPLIMAFLVRIGIVEPRFFREKRRYAIFFLVLIAAVITPGDIVPMTMMALPLLALYELGIALAVLAGRRRAARESQRLEGADATKPEPV